MAAKKTELKKPLPAKLPTTEIIVTTPSKAPAKSAVKVVVVKKTVKPPVEVKQKKPKIIRDSYSIPSDEYAQLQLLKERCAAKGQAIKKSELLRAGILKLVAMKDPELLKLIASVTGTKAVVPPKP